MEKKEFRAESKRLLDLMINSIYTHREIFLRELISNASDAIDKRYYYGTRDGGTVDRSEYFIRIQPNEAERTLTVIDNGCGMTAQELETNLGTIALSGTEAFAREAEKLDDMDIIGKFGVGFYSAFMVSSKIEVYSRTEGGEANLWESEGNEGYSISPCDYPEVGTKIVLHLREDGEDCSYSDFLKSYRLSSLVKKYSDYIRWPIRMVEEKQEKEEDSEEYKTVLEDRTLNSMVPLWRKNKSEITREQYNDFYRDNFGSYEDPISVLHVKAEGMLSYNALLFIPKNPPYDFFTKSFKRGLKLYANGVMIMDSCEELLPEYFGFVRGLVDSPDLSLNISRELLQHDRQLSAIANNLKKKIQAELLRMQKEERENYESFFAAFGLTLKYGVYSGYGMNKDFLQELLMYRSAKSEKLVTLKEYTDGMVEEQKEIYYAAAGNAAMAKALPQCESVLDRGYDVLLLSDDVDEFALRMMDNYAEKPFMSVCDPKLDLAGEDEKKKLEEKRESNKGLLERMETALAGKVKKVALSPRLKNAASSLVGEEGISVEMYKVLSSMPNAKTEELPAEFTLELNPEHPVFAKLNGLDDAKLADYATLLYEQARLSVGLPLENPAAFCALVAALM